MIGELYDYVVGVDTHRDFHVAAIVASPSGGLIESARFTADAGGYEDAVAWVEERTGCDANTRCWAIEGTGSYGAGFAGRLDGDDETVYEIDRPNRPSRRLGHDKNDHEDAVRAARDLIGENRPARPRSGALGDEFRILSRTREGAVSQRTAVICQMKAAIVIAPEELRSELRPAIEGRGRSYNRLVDACAALGDRCSTDTEGSCDCSDQRACAYRLSFSLMARRIEALSAEIDELDRRLDERTRTEAPGLRAQSCVGPVVTAVLVSTWSTQGRFDGEAAFSKAVGTSPIEANSGQTVGRHRLNRGGDRRANAAIHRIVIGRIQRQQETRDYIDRRCADGKTRREASRCLARYVSRAMYRLLESGDAFKHPQNLVETP